MTDRTPSWQPDPTGKHDHRYWDGSQWTENVSNAGVASTDPYEATAVSAGAEDVAATPEAEAPAAPEAAAPAATDEPTPVDPTVVTPTADATASWPTVEDAPAAWPAAPAPPPPYVPTTPVTSGGGRSKKGLLIGGGILAAVAVVVAILALGGDDDDSDVRAQLASTLQREGDLSESDAECVADIFVDEIGEDAFKDVDFSSDDPPAELTEAFIEAGPKAIQDCDIDEGAFGGTTDSTDDGATDSTDGSGGEGTYGSDPELDALYDDCADGDYAACDQLFADSPSGSEYEDFGDTCGDRNEPQGYCVDLYSDGGDDGGGTDLTDGAALPDNFEDILADTYESTFDLSRDQAECLANKLASAIEDGDITETEAMTQFMDYLSDCDISPEDISGN